MSYSRARADWEDFPSLNTLVRAQDLDQWDQKLYELANAVFYAGSTEFPLLSDALSAASAAGYGKVVLPSGTTTYSGSSPLSVPANVTLEGSGKSSVLNLTGGVSGYLSLAGDGAAARNLCLRRGSSTPSRLLQAAGANCLAQNLYFDGQGGTYDGPVIGNGSGADGLLVTGCTFDTVNGSGISFNNINRIRVIGNRWVGHLSSSFSPIIFNATTGSITEFVIANNLILTDPTNTQASIVLVTSGLGFDLSGGTITGNTISGASTGIVIQKTASGNRPFDMTVSGNRIKLLADASSGSGISIDSNDHTTVVGNSVFANGFLLDNGIELVASNYVTVCGNTIDGDAKTLVGIMVNRSNYGTVTGNVIRDFKDTTAGRGISVFSGTAALSSSDNAISGNTILFLQSGATARIGISVESNHATATANRNAVTGNVIYGDNVASSKGISLNNNGAGTVDRNLVGMNIMRNVATGLNQSGDTNSLVSGTTWNVT